MMGNKWVQAGLLMGLAVGVWVGGWISAIHLTAFLIASTPIRFMAAIVIAKARGTDGWDGPYRGKP